MGDVPQLPFPILKTERIVDIYLDTTNGKFYQQGVFIRNRNNFNLDFKFNLESLLDKNALNDHSHCDEHTFDIPFKPSIKDGLQNVCALLKLNLPRILTFEEFITTNLLRPLVTIDKKRHDAKDSGFNLCIDIIKGVGNFIEIEKMVSLNETESEYQKILDKEKQNIKSYMHSLGVNVEQLETGYVELVLKETNFELYKKGKYLLNKDKRH